MEVAREVLLHAEEQLYSLLLCKLAFRFGRLLEVALATIFLESHGRILDHESGHLVI
jgi:hypothetical protein